ncbi:hypothetical protein BX661DRAFT_33788 [Kickxella alabastrina]|uniref:uncharacterized protein n=1 Tax=Kickxella alabastrina TaxID=61397 RepID=UPI00221F7D41|nr:uncharacterized protein BX661DRAFT_33788 [Kickxella alabastrina]KAI7826446.1 hypothetical protein BX661DRAFT_33788 [Kickxella alabastrina]
MPRKATRKGLLRAFSPRVGYAYDLRMQYHCDLDDTDDPHPEDPRRTYWIHNLLERSDLLSLMHAVKIFPATDTQILRVHRSHYINSLEKTKVMERASLIDEQNKYDSVYLCSESYYCAKLSAGGLLSLCHEVVSGRLDSGFAIVRPPGHHACKSKAMGFCLLNNIAIAIEDILLNGLAERIMVVDWDIHHGNGIQDIFIRNPNVLYCSLHRYDGGDFYPASNEGNMDKVGKDAGRGFNINIPWVTSGMGDGDYLYAFNQLIIPWPSNSGRISLSSHQVSTQPYAIPSANAMLAPNATPQ